MPHIGEKAQFITLSEIPAAAVTVPVTGSPFTFKAPRNGMVLISGGTLSNIQYSRGNAVNVLGAGTSQIMMMTNDSIRLTYLGNPTITFLPTQ